jgi:anthranilate phosphoribosyltransferase
MTVHGMDGLDEISVSAETLVGELKDGEINEYTIHPSQFALEMFDRRAIQVNSVEESKDMVLAALGNQPGPAHNVVALNAGAAIYVSGVAPSLKAGVERARQTIASGAAKKKLDEFVAFTQSLKA